MISAKKSLEIASIIKKTLLSCLACWLRRAVEYIDAGPQIQDPVKLSPEDLSGLAGSSRMDWKEFHCGSIRMRYSATDPVWNDVDADPRLTDLREHLRRLCLAAQEMGTHQMGEGWDEVAHSLRLAYSLGDVFATTDIDGSSLWCNSVAEYEAANEEVTEKHLAATIVFTFAWTAYERAVALMTGPKRRKTGRGALGRDLVAVTSGARIPFLRDMLLRATQFDGGGTNYCHPDMRRMLRSGSVPGIAGEYLRQFRNRLIHGNIQKPEPCDWGPESEYIADEDPCLRRFHVNIRLLLLLIQLLAMGSLEPDSELESWMIESYDAHIVLRRLHCNIHPVEEWQSELDLGDEYAEFIQVAWRT